MLYEHTFKDGSKSRIEGDALLMKMAQDTEQQAEETIMESFSIGDKVTCSLCTTPGAVWFITNISTDATVTPARTVYWLATCHGSPTGRITGKRSAYAETLTRVTFEWLCDSPKTERCSLRGSLRNALIPVLSRA